MIRPILGLIGVKSLLEVKSPLHFLFRVMTNKQFCFTTSSKLAWDIFTILNIKKSKPGKFYFTILLFGSFLITFSRVLSNEIFPKKFFNKCASNNMKVNMFGNDS